MKSTEKFPIFFGGNFIGGYQAEKIGDFYSIKFVGDSEPNFWGTSGGKNWGVSQHEICGRFRTKFLGDFWGEKH